MINYFAIPGITKNVIYKDKILKGYSMDKDKLSFYERIKTKLEEIYGIPNILAINRRAHYVKARATFVYLLRKYTSLSYVSIGMKFNRDHSTIIHNEKVAQNYIDTEDFEFLNKYNKMRSHIENEILT